MNRGEVVIGGVAGIAAAVAAPIVAKAEDTTNENPELDPIRALLDAYDTAFSKYIWTEAANDKSGVPLL